MSDEKKSKELLPDILTHHRVIDEKIASINMIITNFEQKWDVSEGKVQSKEDIPDDAKRSPIDDIYRGMDDHEKALMRCISRLQTLQERYLGC